ncbi:MAG: HAD family hydrolase [Candidatus Dormibacteraceae bacterium]
MSDLDGTLLLPGAHLGEATAAALESLHEESIPFVVATGRSIYGMEALGASRRLVQVAVCSSGSIGYDPASERILWRRPLDPATLERVVAAILEEVPDAGIGSFDGGSWAVTPSYLAARGAWPTGPRRIVEPEALVSSGGCALVVSHAELRSADIAARLREAGIEGSEATLTWAGPAMLDIVSPDVDKAYGVRRACELLGVAPEDVVAFGDGPNDLSMFRIVGLAVAVANAHPDVLRAADLVTASNEEEGVASMLADLGLIAPGVA